MVKNSEELEQWFAQHGESLQDILECRGPSDLFIAALSKMVESFLMSNGVGYPCEQTREAKAVIEPFIRGGEPTDISALRRAYVIQNMNLLAAGQRVRSLSDQLHQAKKPKRSARR